jgi:hypothetical protein
LRDEITRRDFPRGLRSTCALRQSSKFGLRFVDGSRPDDIRNPACETTATVTLGTSLTWAVNIRRWHVLLRILVHGPRDHVHLLPGYIREGTVGYRPQFSLDNLTMHCYRMSSLMAFTISDPISLFYLAIVILSFTTHYAHSPHLIDICNTIWLILLAASTNDFIVLLVSYTTVSESSETIFPSPSIRTPSPHTPNQPLPHADEQGASYRVV